MKESEKKESEQKYHKLLYAEDAKRSNTPWQWWEYRERDTWFPANNVPLWDELRYRRNPSAPKRFIDFNMDLTDYSKDQRQQVQEWAFEQGYRRPRGGGVCTDFKRLIFYKVGDVYITNTWRENFPILTPAECGIQLESVGDDIQRTIQQKQIERLMQEPEYYLPNKDMQIKELQQEVKFLQGLINKAWEFMNDPNHGHYYTRIAHIFRSYLDRNKPDIKVGSAWKHKTDDPDSPVHRIIKIGDKFALVNESSWTGELHNTPYEAFGGDFEEFTQVDYSHEERGIPS